MNQKKRTIYLFLSLSENIMNMSFQAFLPEKKKEKRKLRNVNLIKSAKYSHRRNIYGTTEGKVGETTKTSYRS